MRLSMNLKRSGKAAIAAIAFASLASAAHAGRYTEKPPIMLSPGLTTPWVMQLQGNGAGINQTARAQKWQQQQRQRKAYASKRYQPRAAQRKVVRRAAKTRGMDPAFLPATVAYSTKHKKGTIIVDTSSKYLYLVLGNGQARRYGVGVGKQGFEWSGTQKISRKAKWPSWTPPKEMIARERKKGRILPAYMPGGPENPMGARGLYLGSTLYRIHGTNQPWTIGRAMSSGCIRMRNQDVTALYEQVRVGARVIVM